jgi:hypothetical protein
MQVPAAHMPFVQLSEQQSVACVHAPVDAQAAAVHRLVVGSQRFEQHSLFIVQALLPGRHAVPPSPIDAERSGAVLELLCEQAPAISATEKNRASGRMRFTSQN